MRRFDDELDNGATRAGAGPTPPVGFRVAREDLVKVGNDFHALTHDEDRDDGDENAGQIDFLVVYGA